MKNFMHARRSATDGCADRGIRRTGMSAYGHSYTDEDLRTLAGFVRRMKDLPPPVLAALREKKG